MTRRRLAKILMVNCALLFIPIAVLINHLITWGPSERTENLLGELYRDAITLAGPDEEVAVEHILVLLDEPKYEFLKSIRDPMIESRNNELMWFSPNRKYSLALRKDGYKIWIVNGIRSPNCIFTNVGRQLRFSPFHRDATQCRRQKEKIKLQSRW